MKIALRKLKPFEKMDESQIEQEIQKDLDWIMQHGMPAPPRPENIEETVIEE